MGAGIECEVTDREAPGDIDHLRIGEQGHRDAVTQVLPWKTRKDRGEPGGRSFFLSWVPGTQV